MSDREQAGYATDPEEDLGAEFSAEDLNEEDWSEPMSEELDNYAADSVETMAAEHRDPVLDEAMEAETDPQASRRDALSSPLALGTLFFLATVVAAVGLGYGVMIALGGSPAQLLDFGGLLAFDQILNFGAHPANLFWLLAAAVTVLALLVSGAVSRVVKKVRHQSHGRQTALNRLTSLTFDAEEDWHAPELQDDPAVAAFAANILHEWRVVQGKLTRSISQDAELRRLEKALIDNTRVDMAGGFESPAVSSLADEVLRQFDDRICAEQDRQALVEKLAAEGAEQVAIIAEACNWNTATLDQISVQGAALERLGVKSNKLTEATRQLGESLSGEDRRATLARMQEELATVPTVMASGSGGVAPSALREVADRASKLTFKITMEVARLGAKGESLVPLTQALEDLTTGFRDLADGNGGSSAGQNELAAALGRVRQQLATLQESEEQIGGPQEGWQNLVESADEIAPMTRQIGEKLVTIAREFNQQSERLTELGNRHGQLTGATFDPADTSSGNTVIPSSGGLTVDRYDPFGGRKTAEETTPQVADPFAGASHSPFDDDAPDDSDNDLGSIMAPEVPSISQLDEPTADGQEDTESSADAQIGHDDQCPADPTPMPSAEPMTQPDTQPEAALPSDEDRVYDLVEFGAVPLTEENQKGTEAAGEDRIYDLEEFGAVAIG